MKRTESVSSMSRAERDSATSRDLFAPRDEPYARPSEFTRADCRGHDGPCPMISCAHHLMLDVSNETGAIRYNHGDPELHRRDHDGAYLESVLRGMRFTCALDAADAVAEGLELEWEEFARLIGTEPDWALQFLTKSIARLRENVKDGERLAQLRVPAEARKR